MMRVCAKTAVLCCVLAVLLLSPQTAFGAKNGVKRFITISEPEMQFANIATVVQFCKDRCIDGVYLARLNPWDAAEGTTLRTQYTSMVNTFHANALQVYALVGVGDWTVPCEQKLNGQVACQEDGRKFYRALLSLNLPFDGIADQSLPYTTDTAHFDANPALRIQWTIDYLKSVQQIAGNVVVRPTVTHWMDASANTSCLSISGQQCKPASFYICKLTAKEGCDVTDNNKDPAIFSEAVVYELTSFPTRVLVWEDKANKDYNMFDGGVCAMETLMTRMATNASLPRTNLGGFVIQPYESYASLAASGNCLPLQCDASPAHGSSSSSSPATSSTAATSTASVSAPISSSASSLPSTPSSSSQRSSSSLPSPTAASNAPAKRSSTAIVSPSTSVIASSSTASPSDGTAGSKDSDSPKEGLAFRNSGMDMAVVVGCMVLLAMRFLE